MDQFLKKDGNWVYFNILSGPLHKLLCKKIRQFNRHFSPSYWNETLFLCNLFDRNGELINNVNFCERKKIILKSAYDILSNYSRPIDKHVDICTFLCRKGSKKFRKFIGRDLHRIGTLGSDKSVANLSTVLLYDLTMDTECFFSFWSFNSIPGYIANFAYKFVCNQLCTNVRKSHFSDVSRKCSYCLSFNREQNIYDEDSLNDETYDHLFFDCNITKVYWDLFFNTNNINPRRLFTTNNKKWILLAFIIIRNIFCLRSNTNICEPLYFHEKVVNDLTDVCKLERKMTVTNLLTGIPFNNLR